jgi:hypothetical protein
MGSRPHLARTTAPGIADGRTVARAPDNELYDRGADLVEAAMAIRRVAGSPEATRAAPAVLGCVEAALQELVMASAALEQAVAEVASTTPACRHRRCDRVVERMHRGYANLHDALFDAHAAAAAARSLTSRALGRPARGS